LLKQNDIRCRFAKNRMLAQRPAEASAPLQGKTRLGEPAA